MTTRKIEVYNNSYFSMPLWEDCVVRDGLDNQRPAIRNGFFSESVPPRIYWVHRCLPTILSILYNKWVYDPETKQYIRYQETDDIRNDKPEKYDVLMDQVTGEASTPPMLCS